MNRYTCSRTEKLTDENEKQIIKLEEKERKIRIKLDSLGTTKLFRRYNI